MEIYFTLKQNYGKVRAVPLCINAIMYVADKLGMLDTLHHDI